MPTLPTRERIKRLQASLILPVLGAPRTCPSLPTEKQSLTSQNLTVNALLLSINTWEKDCLQAATNDRKESRPPIAAEKGYTYICRLQYRINELLLA